MQFTVISWSSLCASLFLLGNEIPQLVDLYKDVVPKYAARWKDLGIKLKIPQHDLNIIEADNVHHPTHAQQCCKDMLSEWMKITPNPTWNILKKAIDGLPSLSHDGNSKSKNTMGLFHYSCMPLNLFYIPYMLDSLPRYLLFANGAGGVGIF